MRLLTPDDLDYASIVASHKRWGGSCLGGEDRLQEAVLGLLRAAMTHDPSKGAKWSTHATTAMHGSIIDAIRRERGSPGSSKSKANIIHFSAADEGGRSWEPPAPEESHDEYIDLVESLARRLTKQQAECFRCLWGKGMTRPEAAKHMRTSLSNIHHLAGAAILRLRKIVDPETFMPRQEASA